MIEECNMSENITEDILLRAGMYKVKDSVEYISQVGGQKYTIQVLKYSVRDGRNYSCGVFNENDYLVGFAYIQTIDHFNKLMEIMNINFKLKEE